MNLDLSNLCSCGTTVDNQNTSGSGTGTGLITIIILILVVCFFGGKVFGGYGNYPGYGGFSEYGYTPHKPKRYRYFDDYYAPDEPDY